MYMSGTWRQSADYRPLYSREGYSEDQRRRYGTYTASTWSSDTTAQTVQEHLHYPIFFCNITQYKMDEICNCIGYCTVVCFTTDGTLRTLQLDGEQTRQRTKYGRFSLLPCCTAQYSECNAQ